MEPVVRIRVKVRGRVQGVWYRGSARERALALGVRGWVRNCPDGAVELEAQGTREAVDALVEWCRSGPPLARVDHLSVEAVEPGDKDSSFEIRR